MMIRNPLFPWNQLTSSFEGSPCKEGLHLGSRMILGMNDQCHDRNSICHHASSSAMIPNHCRIITSQIVTNYDIIIQNHCRLSLSPGSITNTHQATALIKNHNSLPILLNHHPVHHYSAIPSVHVNFQYMCNHRPWWVGVLCQKKAELRDFLRQRCGNLKVRSCVASSWYFSPQWFVPG